LRAADAVPHNRGVTERSVAKEELEATIEARKELGAEMEPALIDAFVERIDRRLAERGTESERALKARRDHQKELILGAMGISVPLLLFAAIFTGLAGVIAVCAALAVIAVVARRSP
jgi:VIT1/CCC1 family predicted Fe2+/Mn2+ transporter